MELKLETIEYYDWDHTVKYIEEKYGINVYENFDSNYSYWDFLYDHAFGEVCAGMIVYVNWVELLFFAKKDWQKEITKKFISEFGEDYTSYMLCW